MSSCRDAGAPAGSWIEKSLRVALLETWLLGIVRVADGGAQAAVELAGANDDLLRMDGIDRIVRDDEIASILDEDDDVAVRHDLPHRAELLAAIFDERLVPDLDLVLHRVSIHRSRLVLRW